jgi:hypothetical protein
MNAVRRRASSVRPPARLRGHPTLAVKRTALLMWRIFFVSLAARPDIGPVWSGGVVAVRGDGSKPAAGCRDCTTVYPFDGDSRSHRQWGFTLGWMSKGRSEMTGRSISLDPWRRPPEPVRWAQRRYSLRPCADGLVGESLPIAPGRTSNSRWRPRRPRPAGNIA